jgi:hypothetical protein
MNVKVHCSGKINVQMWGRGKDAKGLQGLMHAMCIDRRTFCNNKVKDSVINQMFK